MLFCFKTSFGPYLLFAIGFGAQFPYNCILKFRILDDWSNFCLKAVIWALHFSQLADQNLRAKAPTLRKKTKNEYNVLFNIFSIGYSLLAILYWLLAWTTANHVPMGTHGPGPLSQGGQPLPQAACQQTPHKGQGSKANKGALLALPVYTIYTYIILKAIPLFGTFWQ